jgi:hypothetical protein
MLIPRDNRIVSEHVSQFILNLLRNAERNPETYLKHLTLFQLRSGFLWGQGRVQLGFETRCLAGWLMDSGIFYSQ